MPRSYIKYSRAIWKTQIEQLELYCEKRKWKIEYVTNDPRSDAAVFAENKLIIQSDRKPEITFYYFLHELGHMIAFHGNKSYYDSSKEDVDFHNSSQAHKVKCIEEEFDAWKRGLKLSKRLNLVIERKKFESIKARCITSYMMWALERKFKKALDEANK